MGKKADILIEIKEWGSIFSYQLEIEGNVISNLSWDPKKKVQFKKLKDYEIGGALNLFFRCKGQTGAKATLNLEAKEVNISEEIKCVITNGPCTISKSYEIS